LLVFKGFHIAADSFLVGKRPMSKIEQKTQELEN
jgi:hypothetical protein